MNGTFFFLEPFMKKIRKKIFDEMHETVQSL